MQVDGGQLRELDACMLVLLVSITRYEDVPEFAAVDDVEGLQAGEGGTLTHRKSELEAWTAAQVQVPQASEVIITIVDDNFAPYATSHPEIRYPDGLQRTIPILCSRRKDGVQAGAPLDTAPPEGFPISYRHSIAAGRDIMHMQGLGIVCHLPPPHSARYDFRHQSRYGDPIVPLGLAGRPASGLGYYQPW